VSKLRTIVMLAQQFEATSRITKGHVAYDAVRVRILDVAATLRLELVSVTHAKPKRHAPDVSEGRIERHAHSETATA